jgi:hypothetical protein
MTGYLIIAILFIALPLSVLPIRIFNTGYLAKTALWSGYLALTIAPTLWAGHGGEHDLELFGLSGLMIILAIAYAAEANTWRKNGEPLRLSANGFTVFIAYPAYYIATVYAVFRLVEGKTWTYAFWLASLYLISILIFKLINDGRITNLMQPLLLSYPSALVGLMYFDSPFGLLCGLPLFTISITVDFLTRPKAK